MRAACLVTISHKVACYAVRIGLAYVASLGKDDAAALVAERDANVPTADVGDLARRAPVSGDALAGARARWRLRRLRTTSRPALGDRPPTRPRSVEGTRGRAKQLPLELDPTVATPELRDLTRWERMLADYRGTGLSVGDHPLALLRSHLPSDTLTSVELLNDARHGAQVSYAGLAIARQRPSTANGIVFMLLEDEHDQVNLIVPSAVYETHRAIVRSEPLLLVHGRFERVDRNRNVLVSSLESLSALARRVAALGRGRRLATSGAPFRAPLMPS